MEKESLELEVSESFLKRGLRRAKSYAKSVKQLKLAKAKHITDKINSAHVFSKSHCSAKAEPLKQHHNPRKTFKNSKAAKTIQERSACQEKLMEE